MASFDKANKAGCNMSQNDRSIDCSVVVPLYNEGLVVEELYERLTRTMGETGLDYELIFVEDGSTDNTLEKLKDIASNTSLLQKATRAWYKNQPLSSLAATSSVSEELLAAVIHSAVKPFLTTHAEALISLVNQEQWRRGYCPICGGKPDFAFLDKERGARWLLCSRCDAQWLFQRLQCPYCGTQDQNALAYFTDEEELHLYRLYVCEQCHTYIKAIDLRRVEREVFLPLERVMTLDMDKQGQEKGYRPGWTNLIV